VYLENRIEIERLRTQTKELLQKYLLEAQRQKQKAKEVQSQNKQTDKKMMEAE